MSTRASLVARSESLIHGVVRAGQVIVRRNRRVRVDGLVESLRGLSAREN